MKTTEFFVDQIVIGMALLIVGGLRSGEHGGALSHHAGGRRQSGRARHDPQGDLRPRVAGHDPGGVDHAMGRVSIDREAQAVVVVARGAMCTDARWNGGAAMVR